MALLVAKQDPLVAFADLDTSQAAQDAALASYTRTSSTTATVTLKTISGDDYLATITGSSLPANLGNDPALLFTRFGKISVARKSNLASPVFSWDGQGTTVSALSLQSAISSGDRDSVLNLFLGGTDTLQADYANVDVSLIPQIENVVLLDNGLNVIGNTAANAITGNSANNRLDGGLGDDTLNGGAGDDTLIGGEGNDLLNGAGGNDLMDGAAGSDRYLIAAPSEHSVAEISDTGVVGIDECRFTSQTAGQTLRLFAGDTGLERVVIGTGSAFSADSSGTIALNVDASLASSGLEILGNGGANLLHGSLFADQISGSAGNDTLKGSGGNDLLNGGAGNDAMDGGEDSDLYLIASSAEHTLAEIKDTGSSGVDELRFGSSTAGQVLTLFAGDTGLERVVVGSGSGPSADTSGSTALSVNASALSAGLTIIGNNGANSLSGGSGADVLSGNGANDSLVGGSGNDSLDGGIGADLLRGGLGMDTLSGGAAADVFRFDTALNASTNVDRVSDFSLSEADRFQLENTGTGLFTAITTTGTLAQSAFIVGNSFTTTSQRIRYQSGTGQLFYDATGSGAGSSEILFAILTPGLALTNTQFVVT